MLRSAICASTLLGIVLLCGCGQSAPASSTPGKPKIGLVMKSLANEFFGTMEKGARAHQKEHEQEYDLISNGIKDETDLAAQINIVENMINSRVNAIVLAPADSKALVPVCKKAMDAGIVVINIDNKFDETALAEKNIKIPFVGPDNRKGAGLAGTCLAKKLKSGDPVAILEGSPGAFNAIQRKLGFEDAIKAAGLKVVSSQTANWEALKAEAVVAGMIREHPEIKGILCSNDSMAIGAVSAIKSAQKLDQVTIVGFDNISDVQARMKKGEILCTVDQHGDKIAAFGIEYALEILKKKSTPADKETPVDLITADSLK
ncbi:MAG TPA: sugar ABC transporter substrate-binding protein [Planctomycetota bacterium]|jgi:ribose transport system substrate-binding protein